MPDRGRRLGFHELRDGRLGAWAAREDLLDSRFTYSFENFFHPYVGALIERLNKRSLPGLLDPKFHETLRERFFENFYA
ncbi:MAG: hypothetical protein QOE61_3560, partial [Micromonosporaceae bacterium]|nr:hypothetical protein [Micromonosporaceae bacterium]